MLQDVFLRITRGGGRGGQPRECLRAAGCSRGVELEEGANLVKLELEECVKLVQEEDLVRSCFLCGKGGGILFGRFLHMSPITQ